MSELDGYEWCDHVGTWLPEGECDACVEDADVREREERQHWHDTWLADL